MSRDATLAHRIIAVILFLESCISVVSLSKFPVIMVVSMDGFRPDYVEDCLTPNIVKLRSSGVYAPFMKNVFPTKTLPNHHTIATGVHPGVHGVLDSTVYISKDGCSCSNRTVVGYSYELYHYNNDILPIWTLNQLAGKGRHSGVMMWPGGEFPYGCKKTMPTFFKKLDFNVSFEDRIDTVISWVLDDTKPANLVMLYLEEPDLHGHAFGIESTEVRYQIKRLDKALGYMAYQFEKYGIKELVSVFVVSDHGMISLHQKNIMDLNKFVNESMYTTAGYSPVLQIFPNNGSDDRVLSGLKKASEQLPNKFDVFTRSEIPSIWHYADNNRTPPILVVAREGYAFQDFYKNIDTMNKQYHIDPNPRNRYGIHGYSNASSMYPFFFAWGPLLQSGLVLEPFHTTELYPLWTILLSIEPEHSLYSSANVSMLRLNSASHQHSDTPDVKVFDTSPNRNGSSYFHFNHFPPSSPAWIYWFSGLIAVSLLVVITGLSVYFCRDFRCRTRNDPMPPQRNRGPVENQHLLVSDSEDEYKL